MSVWLASLRNLPGGRSAGSQDRGHPASVDTEPVSSPPTAGECLVTCCTCSCHSSSMWVVYVLAVQCYLLVVLIHISTFSQVHWGADSLSGTPIHVFASLRSALLNTFIAKLLL